MSNPWNQYSQITSDPSLEVYTGTPSWMYRPTTTGIKHEKVEQEPAPFIAYGWICPICGRALSPWTSCCPCNVKTEVTCTTQ